MKYLFPILSLVIGSCVVNTGYAGDATTFKNKINRLKKPLDQDQIKEKQEEQKDSRITFIRDILKNDLIINNYELQKEIQEEQNQIKPQEIQEEQKEIKPQEIQKEQKEIKPPVQDVFSPFFIKNFNKKTVIESYLHNYADIFELQCLEEIRSLITGKAQEDPVEVIDGKKLGKIIDNDPSKIGLFTYKMTAPYLFALENIAKKYWKKYPKLLTLLAVYLRTMAAELALIIKTGTHDRFYNKFTTTIPACMVSYMTLNEITEKIYEVSEKLIETAITISKGTLNKNINKIKEKLFKKSHSTEKGRKDQKKAIRALESLYTNYQKLISNDGIKKETIISSKVKKAFDVTTEYEILDPKKDNSYYTQMYYGAFDNTIPRKRGVEYLVKTQDGQYSIDNTCHTLREKWLEALCAKGEICSIFGNPISYNQFTKLATGKYLKIYSPELGKALHGKKRKAAISNVYKNITIDVLLTMQKLVEILKTDSYISKEVKDRILAVIAATTFLVVEAPNELVKKWNVPDKKQKICIRLIYGLCGKIAASLVLTAEEINSKYKKNFSELKKEVLMQAGRENYSVSYFVDTEKISKTAQKIGYNQMAGYSDTKAKILYNPEKDIKKLLKPAPKK